MSEPSGALEMPEERVCYRIKSLLGMGLNTLRRLCQPTGCVDGFRPDDGDLVVIGCDETVRIECHPSVHCAHDSNF